MSPTPPTPLPQPPTPEGQPPALRSSPRTQEILHEAGQTRDALHNERTLSSALGIVLGYLSQQKQEIDTGIGEHNARLRFLQQQLEVEQGRLREQHAQAEAAEAARVTELSRQAAEEASRVAAEEATRASQDADALVAQRYADALAAQLGADGRLLAEPAQPPGTEHTGPVLAAPDAGPVSVDPAFAQVEPIPPVSAGDGDDGDRSLVAPGPLPPGPQD